MAKGKRHVQRLPARSRTRQHKPKLADPDSSAELTAQLSALGLRLHNTLGDGNCLFRALSDQLYGTESHHLKLRAEITAWMAKYAERYEGFVEDDRSFEDHLRCMREPGTYGGHLELSAFAHLKRKNVKVIQPGLVYVIEWDAGSPFPELPRDDDKDMVPLSPDGDRDRRRSRREKRRPSADVTLSAAPGSSLVLGDTVYVAYHDWEHFSSLRTLAGERPVVVHPPPSHTIGTDANESLSNDSQFTSTSASVPPLTPVVSEPVAVPTVSSGASPATTSKVKRPRGRPRKHLLPTDTDTPPIATPPTLSVTPSLSASSSSSLAPSALPPPRSLSPSATSSASTVVSLSGSTSSSTTTNSASGSTASSSLPPVTPSDSQSLLDPHLAPQPPASIEPRSGPVLLSHSVSSARTRKYDPLFTRSSPKRHFVEGEGDADSNGFASEDSETRSAKRRVGRDGRVLHQAPSGSRTSHLNPSFALSTASSQPPMSRASSTTPSLAGSAMDDVNVSEAEAPLTQFGDADADSGERIADGDEDEDTTIGGPPSPTAKTTRHLSKPRAVTSAGEEKGDRLLTRRERKKLGLPKPRPRRVILKVNGQRPGSVCAAVEDSMQPSALPDTEQAWATNGSGRMDVRGFRELKI